MESSRRITSFRQLELLFEFMERNRDLALGRVRSKKAQALASRLWNQCSETLNSLGPARSGKEWAKVWNDQKCRVRANLVAINASQQATGGGPSNAPVLTPLEEKVASIIGLDVGPMPNVRQDQFSGDGNDAVEEVVVEAMEEVVEQPALPGNEPQNVIEIAYEDLPHTQPFPVPSISGQTPSLQAQRESTSEVRRPSIRRRAGHVGRQPATNQTRAPQEITSRNALEESRSVVLKIEEMRAEAALYNKQAMVNFSESLRMIAESIDRMSRQYCSTGNPKQDRSLHLNS